MKLIALFIGTFLALVGEAVAECQRDLALYRLQTWRTDDGLPLDAVYSLAQTPDGFVWIGTEAGLARFDGARFDHVDLSSITRGASEHVPALAATPDGFVLAGARTPGLIRIGPDSVDLLPLEVAVSGMLQTSDGALWIATDNAGLWVRPASGKRARRIKGTRSNRIGALAHRKDGGIWVGYGNAGVQYVHESKVFDIESETGSFEVVALEEDRSGRLWIGTRNGLFRHGAKNLESVPQVEEAVAALMQDETGDLWIGLGDGGLRRFCNARPEAMDELSAASGLPKGPVKDLLQTRDGSVWVATHGGGVLRLSKGAVLPVMSDQGLPDRPVLPLLSSQRGTVIAGTFGAGIVTIDSTTYRVSSSVEGLSSDHVFSLAPAPDGGFWAGTRRGIALVHDGQVVREYSDGNGLPSSTTISLLADEDRLWIGTSAGLASLEGMTISRYGAKSGQITAAIVQMHLDRRDRLWVGTDGDGLYRLENGVLVRPVFHDEMPSKNVFGFHETEEALWILTTRGLLYWDGRDAGTVLPSAGLPEPQLHAMLDDGQGHFFLSGNLGVFSVDKDDLVNVARKGGTLQTVRRFTKEDGMPRSETNGGFQPAAARSADGRLWFPTSEGIAVFDPEQALVPIEQPAIVVTEVAVGDRLVDATALALPSDPLAVRIEYTAPEFAYPERLTFRYRMSGFDPTWHSTTERQVLFHRLPPGDMTFEVQASVEQGHWSRPATLSLSVDRHLLRSPFFWVTLAVALTGVFLAGYTYWSNQRIAGLKRLQSAQKLESIGLLASGIAHDFRNVLQAVIGHIEMLRMDLTPGTQAWDDADQALDSANKGIGIAQQLLTFARRERGLSRLVFLHKELEEMVPFLRRLLPGSVDLEITRLDDVGGCLIDPIQLQQVMMNLVTNAGQAMSDGGVVRLSVEKVADTRARIRVADQGGGIPADIVDRIFEPFFTTKSEDSGTGLGLAVTYGIVKDAGGDIDVETGAGGTDFHVFLPVSGSKGV